MGLDDRVVFFLIGCAIGFFLGYVIRTLRETKEELDVVHEIVKDTNKSRPRDERGVVSPKFRNSVALAIVVALSVFASFRSQVASNEVTETQDRLVAQQKSLDSQQRQLDSVVGCIVATNTDLLDAINTRTTYTQSQASANKDLQEAQKIFFGILLHIPPYSDAVKDEAARTYDGALDAFLKAATASEKNALFTKYPDAKGLLSCIDSKMKEKKE